MKKHYIKINNDGTVLAYCSSELDQTQVGWILIDKIPYDLDVNKSSYKYIDGKLMSKSDQEIIELQSQLEKTKAEYTEKIEFLEMAIMDVADLALQAQMRLMAEGLDNE